MWLSHWLTIIIISNINDLIMIRDSLFFDLRLNGSGLGLTIFDRIYPKTKEKKSTWNKKVITTIFTSSSININATARGWKLLHSMLLISPWWCMLPKSEYNGHLKRVVSGVLAMHFIWNRIWGKMQTAANASKSTLIIFDCFLTLNCTVWSWN